MDILWNYFIQKGVTPNELELLQHIYILLLMLPIVSTIIGVARYIIGTTSLRLYTPIVLTFLFYELGSVDNGNSQDVFKGLRYGLVLFITVLVSATIFYSLIKHLRMHYVPKLTLVLICVAFSLFAVIILALALDYNGFIFINQFTFIVVIILSESIVSAIARKTVRYGVISSADTLILSILCYIIISLPNLQNLIGNNPGIILIVILVNIYVGRFTGLRINEYWRFRNILFSRNNDIPKRDNSK